MTTQTRANAIAAAKAKAGPSASKARDRESTSEAPPSVLDAIQDLRNDLKEELRKAMEDRDDYARSHSLELKQQISQLREELKSSIELVSGRTGALEIACNGHSDSIVKLEEQVLQLRKEVRTVTDRNEDLEAKSRRCNLRISGVKEGRETGKTPVAFMADLLKDALGLDSPPTLDMAYRTMRVRPGDEGPPRAFLIKFHYYQEREATLRKAAKAKELTTPVGDRIWIHPDYTQTVMKQRTAFRDVKKILRECDGVDYRLRYPAVLLITTKSDGQQHSFTDPIKAKGFALALPGAKQQD